MGKAAKILAIFTALLFSTTTTASADKLGCYWNLPGVPYSMDPPPGLEGHLNDSHVNDPYPLSVAFLINHPDVYWKHLCGVLNKDDVAAARERVRLFGCAPSSSLARMIDELPNGGRYLLVGMSTFETIFAERQERLKPVCERIAGTSSDCWLTLPVDAEMRERELKTKPHCAKQWDHVQEFFDVFFPTRTDPNLKRYRELRDRDREMLTHGSDGD